MNNFSLKKKKCFSYENSTKIHKRLHERSYQITTIVFHYNEDTFKMKNVNSI